jgi:sugar transferase (PEP-CTERM/EpsH1 system associated)
MLAVEESRPLVLHLVYRFDTGGIENGVVNLINHLPHDRWRHAVVALTEVVPAFAQRVQRSDVEFSSLHKTAGHAVSLYPQLIRLFRDLRPAVVHTRNLAAMECQLPAAWARVPVRIHGEHGRDVDDLDGSSRKHQWIRRIYRPFIHHHVALSCDLARYLIEKTGLSESCVEKIHNGVDIEKFRPAEADRKTISDFPFSDRSLFVLGTVGRMKDVKAQTVLAQAFIKAIRLRPSLSETLRLVMVGEGPLRATSKALLHEAGLSKLAWLPGERVDVPDVMAELDCFVLPSLAEGISNTILEAMATGIPVIASEVGGNTELVLDGETGITVPAGDVDALAAAILSLSCDPQRSTAMGLAGRKRVEEKFSLPVMMMKYQSMYERLLSERASRLTRG